MDFCLGETCGVGGETLGERICEPPDSSDAVDPLDLLDVLDPATRTGAAPGAPPRQPDEPDEPDERAGFLLGGSGRVGGPLRSMAGPGRGCTIGQGFFCAALITPGGNGPVRPASDDKITVVSSCKIYILYASYFVIRLSLFV